MIISDKSIDAGKPFDWGKASRDYAQFRDIYPEEFYRRIVDKGLCVAGQCILDLGTGTGVLPRNLYRFGGIWTGTDISPEQIGQARQLCERAGMEIAFWAVPATKRFLSPENPGMEGSGPAGASVHPCRKTSWQLGMPSIGNCWTGLLRSNLRFCIMRPWPSCEKNDYLRNTY